MNPELDRVHERLDNMYELMRSSDTRSACTSERLARIEERVEHTNSIVEQHLAAHDKWGGRAFDLVKQYAPAIFAVASALYIFFRDGGSK